MTDYILKALAKADIASDHRCFRLHLETDQGLIRLALDTQQLDMLVTRLQSMEQSAASRTLVPGSGVVESRQLRMEVVDHIQGGTGVVNNVDSMVLILGSGGLSRAFAFDSERFLTLAQVVARELSTMKAKAH